MKITRELSQPIIDKLLPLTERNVNVMDEKGIIVASGDSSRINQIHDGAKIVLEQKREFIIEEASHLSGSKEGVNLPIELNGKIVGVIGITGKPKDIFNLARVVKLTFEVLLQQIYLEKQTRYMEEAIQSWISNLTDSLSYNRERLEKTANLLSIDVEKQRSVLVLKINEINQVNSKDNSPKYLKLFRKKKEYLLKYLGMLLDNQTYIFFKYEKEAVILGKSNKNQNISLAKRIIQMCEKANVQVQIGIGDSNEGVEGYRESFLQARQSLSIIKKMNLHSKENQIFHIDDLRIYYLIKQIPESSRTSFLTKYMSGKWITKEYEETLITYFKEGSSIKKAANSLYIHPNTLLYRLDKIQSLTKLNPKDTMDAFILQLIIICKTLKL